MNLAWTARVLMSRNAPPADPIENLICFVPAGEKVLDPDGNT
jgi:hypothetical protein